MVIAPKEVIAHDKSMAEILTKASEMAQEGSRSRSYPKGWTRERAAECRDYFGPHLAALQEVCGYHFIAWGEGQKAQRTLDIVHRTLGNIAAGQPPEWEQERRCWVCKEPLAEGKGRCGDCGWVICQRHRGGDVLPCGCDYIPHKLGSMAYCLARAVSSEIRWKVQMLFNGGKVPTRVR